MWNSLPSHKIDVLLPAKTNNARKSNIFSLTVSTVNTVTSMGLPTTVTNSTGSRIQNSMTSPYPQAAFCHWNELQYCDVIIVVVNSQDTENCTAKLASLLDQSPGSSYY